MNLKVTTKGKLLVDTQKVNKGIKQNDTKTRYQKKTARKEQKELQNKTIKNGISSYLSIIT